MAARAPGARSCTDRPSSAAAGADLERLCASPRSRHLDDSRFVGVVVALDRPTCGLPREHPTVDVDRFVTHSVQIFDDASRSATGFADDVDLGLIVDLAGAGRDVTHRYVHGIRCVTGLPFLRFTYVEQYCRLGKRHRESVDGDGGRLLGVRHTSILSRLRAGLPPVSRPPASRNTMTCVTHATEVIHSIHRLMHRIGAGAGFYPQVRASSRSCGVSNTNPGCGSMVI